MFRKTLAGEIAGFSPAVGEASFWGLGQMGFAVKAGGLCIVIDLYLSDSPKRRLPAPFGPAEVTFADYFFGTHDHGDHIDRKIWPVLAEASPKAKFVVSACHVNRLSGELGIPEERFIGISDGKTIELPGLKITGVASAHEFLDQDPETGEYPFMGYIVEAGGKTFYHSGDTCLYEGLHEKLRARGKLDLMFLPINGRSGFKYRTGVIGNMTYQEAADLAGAIGPRLVIPCHYNMHSGNLEDPQLFADFMDAKYPGQGYLVCEPGERCVF